MGSSGNGNVIAAIDIGSNAVRLKVARPLPDGSLEALHEERDPVRPGEGVFTTRVIRRDVADRLLSTLRRYAALCRRHHARVRVVATSAVREARNRKELIERVRRESGLELEVVSGQEEARLICLGVLRGKAVGRRSLLIDVGGGSTEIAVAEGERPGHLWTMALGSVRLSELFPSSGVVGKKELRMMRQYAQEVVAEALPRGIPGAVKTALGSSGSVRAVVGYAAAEGTGHATRRQISHAVEELAVMPPEERRSRFDPRRADIIVAGAIIVEAVSNHLKLDSITAVDRGLRDGILVDMIRRRRVGDPSLVETAVELGRRFYFDERHARQVARLAMQLFDGLARLHNLPASARPLLEAAALLHDVGNAVSYQRHHRHTYYLVLNADIPGLADHQRDLVARIARFHRGSAPDSAHALLKDLSARDAQLVRKLAMLLRLADSFDRSHHQPVQKVVANAGRAGALSVRLVARRPVDLELWDANREAPLFRRIFRKRIELASARA